MPSKCKAMPKIRPETAAKRRMQIFYAADRAFIREGMNVSVYQIFNEAGVICIRRDYAKAIAVLPPQDRPTLRAGLMTGSAALRLVDTS